MLPSLISSLVPAKVGSHAPVKTIFLKKRFGTRGPFLESPGNLPGARFSKVPVTYRARKVYF